MPSAACELAGAASGTATGATLARSPWRGRLLGNGLGTLSQAGRRRPHFGTRRHAGRVNDSRADGVLEGQVSFPGCLSGREGRLRLPGSPHVSRRAHRHLDAVAEADQAAQAKLGGAHQIGDRARHPLHRDPDRDRDAGAATGRHCHQRGGASRHHLAVPHAKTVGEGAHRQRKAFPFSMRRRSSSETLESDASCMVMHSMRKEGTRGRPRGRGARRAGRSRRARSARWRVISSSNEARQVAPAQAHCATGLFANRHTLYNSPMATKDVIIPVRVTRADRDLLKRMAPGGSVSAWLRDLALAEARKRRAVVDLARLLDAAKADGDMTDEEAAGLAADAKREVRSRRR